METVINGLGSTVTIVTPEDPGWDEARRPWSLAVDQQPAAIALPTSAQDVMAAMWFARERGLRVAAQGTGHNAKPLGSLSDTMLIKTERMRRVGVEPERMTAWAEAGARWQEVTEAASRHGLAGLAGTAPDVGVVGYTLGGGVGWLSRKYGLSASNVTTIEAVTADGRLVRADAKHESDLFWALRGGGGGLAVVTAIELRLFPVATVCAGLLWWSIEDADRVLRAWRELTRRKPPDEFSTTARLMRFPDAPPVPESMRGRAFTIIDVVHLGSKSEAERILAPLRALPPMIDTVAVIPARGLGPLHMEPDRPVASAGDSLMLTDLPAEAIDEVIRLAGPGADTALAMVELRHTGGELRRARPGNGALAALDADYMVLCGGRVDGPATAAAIDRDTRALMTGMTPWAAHQRYLNFTVDRLDDPARFWTPQDYQRLRRIKAALDPSDLIRSNHPIPLASPR